MTSTGSAGKETPELHIDPMHQFEIFNIFGDSVERFSFTNASLWMFISVILAFFVFVVGTRGRSLIPSRAQAVPEIFFEFVYNMVKDICGEKGIRFFPYIFTLFVFILFCNVQGMVPYAFTVTSHLAVTGFLALTVFVTVTVIGFVQHGVAFLGFFVPKDAPLLLKPILGVIELISYFVRPISHSVRLGANMMAGHAMLKVFAGFATAVGIYGLSGSTIAVSLMSSVMMVGVVALEFLVAFLQAYVFAILTCIYLNDALHMH